MRVLLLSKYDRLGASSRLRSFQYLPFLERHGVSVEVAPLFDDDYVRGLYAHDVSNFHVFRSYLKRIWTLLRRRPFDLIWIEKEALPWIPAYLEIGLLRQYAPLVIDYDDAVFHRYDRHRNILIRSLLARKIDIVMASASAVVAGSEYLVNRASIAGAQRIYKIPTVIDLDRYPHTFRSDSSGYVTIGWIGTPGTASYLSPLVSAFEALRKIHRVRIIAIGAGNRDEFKGIIEVVPWSEDTEVDLLGQIDIGIMPLPDEPFERGKCAYKLIQYMASGKPVVASPVGENIHIVRSGINGLLASSESDWISTLSSLCKSSILRETMGQAGRSLIEKEYSLSVTAPKILELFKKIVR